VLAGVNHETTFRYCRVIVSAGDPTYRRRSPRALATVSAERAFARQALHAQWLQLVHPVTGVTPIREAAPPADVTRLVAAPHGATGTTRAPRILGVARSWYSRSSEMS
jgi:hypothetical protein